MAAPQGTRLPGAPIRLTTADGIELSGWQTPRPVGRPPLSILVAHGFTGSVGNPAVQQIMTVFSRYAAVLGLDQRGHGASGGLSTLGDREALDVDAGVRALRRDGHDLVAAVGWSMGASGVLRQAGLSGQRVHGHRLGPPPDLVVAVSATSRWGVTDTPAMRRVTRLATTRSGRLLARRLGARIDPQGWRPPLPAAPVDVVAAIDPTTLLLVHGDRDHYFSLEHPRALAAAAGPAATLWEVPGFGHAEAGAAAQPELIERLGQHLARAAAARGSRP